MMGDSRLKDKHYELCFEVDRNIRYHSYRRQHYERWHKITMFCAVFFNLASFTFFIFKIGGDDWWSIGIKSLPYMVASALMVTDVLVGFSKKASIHFHFIHRLTDLERWLLAEEDNPTEETVKYVGDSLRTLWAEERSPLKVLNAVCYNEAAQRLGRDDYIRVNTFQRLCANFQDIGTHRLQLVSPAQ